MKLTKSKLKQIIKEELNEIDDDDLAALRPQEENQELVAVVVGFRDESNLSVVTTWRKS